MRTNGEGNGCFRRIVTSVVRARSRTSDRPCHRRLVNAIFSRKCRVIPILLLGMVLCLLCPRTLIGATVSWVGGSGDWSTATNWSTGLLPGTNDDVVINPPGGPFTITHSTGSHIVHSIQSQQAFTLSGGSLTVSNTVQVNSTFTLSGGTLVEATVLQSTNGAVLIVNNSGGTLSGVTVNGTLDVGNTFNNLSVTVTNGLVLNGTALVGNPTNGWNGGIRFAGTQTLSGNGTVVFGDNATYSWNALWLASGGTTLTIGPGITIEGQNGMIGYASAWPGSASNVAVVNQGTIAETVSGGTISVAGSSLLNQGVISEDIGGGTINFASSSLLNEGVISAAASGGAIGFAGNWTNAGTVNVTNVTVTLGGTFTTTNLGVFNRSGGTVYLTGTLINTNTTLSLNALGGSWVLDGGTIVGGTVTATDGVALIVEGTSGTLNGVTVNGTLDVGNSFNNVSATVTNGLALNGTMLLGSPSNQSSGELLFAGTQTLGGDGTVISGINCCQNKGSGYNGFFQTTGTVLTIGPGITVTGINMVLDSEAGAQYINQGTILDVGSGTMGLYGNWTNARDDHCHKRHAEHHRHLYRGRPRKV